MVKIRHKINVDTPGLNNANHYLEEELKRAGDKVGSRLQTLVRQKQRIDTGQERRRTQYKVISRRGELNVKVSVYNTVVQALVDETGAKPHFPPYKQGSKLYGWVLRKGLASEDNPKKAQAVSFLVARAISRRGLPAPNDPLRKPFETTRKDADNMVRTIFNFATLKAVKRVNDEERKR